MYNFEINESVDSIEWNKNLEKSQYSTFFQTAQFLKSQSVAENHFPIFITVFDEFKEVKGQLGLVISKSTSAYSSPVMNKFLNFFAKLGRRAVWSEGPILHTTDTNSRIEILKIILKALEVLAEKNGIVLVDGYTPHQDFLVDEKYKNEFKNKDYQIQNFFTFVTDMNDSLEKIWDGIYKNTKRDIKRAQKRKIFVKELTDFNELDDYFTLSKKWQKTKGIHVELSPKYKKEYWNILKSQIEKVFLAFEDGELVSSHRLGCFNKIAFSHKLTNSYSKPTSLGGPLLTWHAIEWAKKSGMRIYDFSGGESPPNNENERKNYSEQWDSLLRYKSRWGGQKFHYYHFIKIRKKKSYKIFRLFSRLDWIFRNYKRKQYKRPKYHSNQKSE